jgi:hypothetical protein
MQYYVYRITCLHEDSLEKHYYGYRSCKKDPHLDDYWSSSKYVKLAISKYGIHFFKKKILKIFSTREDAIDMEIKLHEKFDVDKNPTFFNRCKQSKWGYNCTGEILRGKSYEEILGSERAKELKLKRSLVAKNKDNSGIKNPMFGKKHTDEMKRKLSESRQGKNHPAYGMKWITNGIESVKIYPDTIVIPENWYFGRTFSSNKGIEEPKYQCIHCLGMFNPGNLKRWHGEKCKQQKLAA